jgi:uncharacterized membrane protein YhaH (DUF805 family)
MEKRTIKGSGLVADIRGGMTDAELITKYSLSRNLLDRAFDLLVEANRISREELESRKSGLKPSHVTPTNISSIPTSISSDSRQSGGQGQEQGHPSKKTPLDWYLGGEQEGYGHSSVKTTINWALEPLKKYAVFKGRARRSEFWVFILANTAIFFILVSICEVLWGIKSGYAMVILTLFSFVIWIPCLAVTVRRLHDIGRSGWWFFLKFLPFVGDIMLLVFLLLDSDPSYNQYGPNPKATTG